MIIVDVLKEISTVMDSLFDFVVNDEFLSKDFECYLQNNNYEIQTSSEFNNVLTEYLLDKKTRAGVGVLDYYREKTKNNSSIIEAFKNSYEGIFKINKISNNTFDVYSLINEQDMTLLSLVKATSLRGVGRCDFLHARIIEYENVFYILEIFDIIGSNYTQKAYQNAIRMLIEKPRKLVWKNEQKLNQIKEESKKMYECFKKTFKKDTLIVTNKCADNIIANFNLIYENKTDEFKEKIEGLEEYSYFKVEEFEDDNFILNASGGFSSHKSLYDIGLMVDLNSGFFAIPFLGTFNKIFEDKSQVKNYKKCILEFLFDDKIPPIVFIKHKNVLDIINPILKENGIKEVGSVDELIKIFKSEWENNYGFSSIEALYNSKLFSEYLGFTN